MSTNYLELFAECYHGGQGEGVRWVSTSVDHLASNSPTLEFFHPPYGRHGTCASMKDVGGGTQTLCKHNTTCSYYTTLWYYNTTYLLHGQESPFDTSIPESGVLRMRIERIVATLAR